MDKVRGTYLFFLSYKVEEIQPKIMEDMDKGTGNQEFRLNRSRRIFFSVRLGDYYILILA